MPSTDQNAGAGVHEIIVIGSGPGGAVTACLLAEAGRQVLLVEEGDDLPQESCADFSMEEMLQKYRNAGLTLALGRPKAQYVEGRCVGGGSEVNSGLYLRTPPEILESWTRNYDLKGAAPDEMTPHFEACERDLEVGPLILGAPPGASLRLVEGAERLGWKSAEIPRWYACRDKDGAPLPEPRRMSMTRTYIPRARAAGCELISRTRILRLRREGGHWLLTGTRRVADGRRRPVELRARNVFVCAGAIHTPALLRRSGVKTHIGDSLRMHPMIKVIACFDDAVNTEGMGVPMHQVKEFSPELTLGCSISAPPYLAMGLNDHGSRIASAARDWRRMAVYYASTIASAAGRIRLVPGFNDPVVSYPLGPEDMRALAEALRRLCRVLLEAGAGALLPSVIGGPIIRGRRDLALIADTLDRARTNLTTVHVFSSCPMGEDRSRCATDSFGAVHGQPGLYISDASLLCDAPGVNPQGTIMALARRNALMFLGRL